MTGLHATDKMEVDGIHIEVSYKDVKYLRLVVYPATGRVRMTAPLRISDAAIRDMALSRLDWIRKQQSRIVAPAPLKPVLTMQHGEMHFFSGQPYQLNIIEQIGMSPRLVAGENNTLNLYVRKSATIKQRATVLDAWYRTHLQFEIPLLIAKWQPVMGVQVRDWGVKKMKTRWGSCNIRAQRIWLNLELAKHSAQCLEYVVVHEMVHLLERSHNARFKKFMDQFLPQWRLLKAELNRSSLGMEQEAC